MKDLFKFVVRPDNLILILCLCLFTGVIAHGENGPTPQVVVGSSGISDGSVTNAKLAEPVSVANGGTGKTTAAEGLAALGGASLNGSSTADFTVSTLTAVTKALLGGATDDGVNKLQVSGEAKFSVNGMGAFKQTYATTSADAATATVVVGDIAGNGDMVTIYLDIVGSRAGPGYEKFHVMIGAYNNAGTIVFVDDAPTVTSDISLGLGMTDPLITCEAVGNTITIKVTVLDAYSRLAINTTAAGYVTGIK